MPDTYTVVYRGLDIATLPGHGMALSHMTDHCHAHGNRLNDYYLRRNLT